MARKKVLKKVLKKTRRQAGAAYKANKSTVERRINKVIDLILTGDESQIVPFCSKEKLTSRQARKYQAKALERLAAVNNHDLEKKRGIAIAQLHKLLRATPARDVRAKTKIHDLLFKIQGLYEKKVLVEQQTPKKDLNALARKYLDILEGKRENARKDNTNNTDD